MNQIVDYHEGTIDRETPLLGTAKRERIELGLALLAARAPKGVGHTSREIAAWCGCSVQAIQQIEKRALAKLKAKLGAVAAQLDNEDAGMGHLAVGPPRRSAQF